MRFLNGWVIQLMKVTVPVTLLAWSLLLIHGDYLSSIYALPGVVGLLVATVHWTDVRHKHA